MFQVVCFVDSQLLFSSLCSRSSHADEVLVVVQVAPFRRKVASMLSDKHEEVMCRMGAIMAAGLLDAGGRNVNLGLRSRSGYFRRTSVVGLAVFLQYWYW